MTRTEMLEHEFVTQLPDELSEGVLYVSMEFGTAAHLCCCGCGKQVLTPLRPNRWRITFDGEGIWLCPSIGNWNFECRSHYFIEGNRVRWALGMTEDEVKRVRARSREGAALGAQGQPADGPVADGAKAGEKAARVGRAVRKLFKRRAS